MIFLKFSRDGRVLGSVVKLEIEKIHRFGISSEISIPAEILWEIDISKEINVGAPNVFNIRLHYEGSFEKFRQDL